MTVLFLGILYYKCEIRLSACDEFINTDVCGTVLKGIASTVNVKVNLGFLFGLKVLTT